MNLRPDIGFVPYRRVRLPRGLAAFRCFELLCRSGQSHRARRLETIRDESAPTAAVCVRAVLPARTSYSAMLPALFHLLVLAHHTYVSYHLLTQIDFTKTDDEYVHNVTKKFRLCYFTSWNFGVQIVYFCICITEDFLRLSKRTVALRDSVRRVKDFIFTSLFFPGTLFVSSMFWGLYMVNRELVFPSAMDVVMPSWTNHSTHTIIIVALVVEMRLTRHRYSKRSLGLATLALYLTVYDLLTLTAFLSDGTWIYPIYRMLDNWALRMLFFVICTGAIFSFYVLGELLNSKLVAYELQRINEELRTRKVC